MAPTASSSSPTRGVRTRSGAPALSPGRKSLTSPTTPQPSASVVRNEEQAWASGCEAMARPSRAAAPVPSR